VDSATQNHSPTSRQSTPMDSGCIIGCRLK
jgi:hypothetical protein